MRHYIGHSCAGQGLRPCRRGLLSAPTSTFSLMKLRPCRRGLFKVAVGGPFAPNRHSRRPKSSFPSPPNRHSRRPKSSFPRKRESSTSLFIKGLWIPAFAGKTVLTLKRPCHAGGAVAQWRISPPAPRPPALRPAGVPGIARGCTGAILPEWCGFPGCGRGSAGGRSGYAVVSCWPLPASVPPCPGCTGHRRLPRCPRCAAHAGGGAPRGPA